MQDTDHWQSLNVEHVHADVLVTILQHACGGTGYFSCFCTCCQ